MSPANSVRSIKPSEPGTSTRYVFGSGNGSSKPSRTTSPMSPRSWPSMVRLFLCLTRSPSRSDACKLDVHAACCRAYQLLAVHVDAHARERGAHLRGYGLGERRRVKG